MVELFKIENNRVMPTTEARKIRVFWDIIRRDKGSTKQKSTDELAYIYFMAHPDSSKNPFCQYGEDKLRHEKIAEYIFENTKWKPDSTVRRGLTVYKDLVETQSVKLLRSARQAIDKLREYFETVDLSEKTESGHLVNKSTDLIKNLSSLGDVVDGLKSLEDKVKTEQQTSNSARKNVPLNEFNQGE